MVRVSLVNLEDPDLTLPHVGPARFVTRVVELASGRIRCEARIPAASPYGRDGTCPAFVLIEAAAQAAAILLGPGPGASTPGYLVRARDIALAQCEVAIHREFEAVACLAGSAPPLHIFNVKVRSGAKTLLQGEISIYVESGSATGG